MRCIVLTATCMLGLTACAHRLSPEEAAKEATKTLCIFYAGNLGPNYESPVIRDELLRRGAHSCLDREIAATRRQNMMVTGFFGPLGGLIHSVANPTPPIEGAANRQQAMDREIAKVRWEQVEQQRRELIASMVAQGASDEDIRKALNSTSPN
jgi:hypothetical protein